MYNAFVLKTTICTLKNLTNSNKKLFQWNWLENEIIVAKLGTAMPHV